MEQTATVRDRPLWRRIVDFPLVAMVIATIAFMLASAAGAIGTNSFLKLQPQNLQLVVASAVTFLLVLLVYKLFITRLGEHPRDDLRGPHALRDLGLGLLIGFGIMAAAVGIAAIAGVYRIVGPGDASYLIPALVGAAIMPAFTEELLFRGILFRFIEEFAGSWAALAVTSALFGLAHILNPNATWFSSFAIAVEAGVLLGGAYMLTRNLWLAMGLHAGWNFTQGQIFDVNVSGIDQKGFVEAQMSGPELLSGGQFGLEASIIALLLATAAGAYMIVLAVRRGHLVGPMWSRSNRPAEPLPA
ncbi:MAG TPA: CPBP family intramembrane glutamic endopeptidase [Sphingomicrobium sp.]|jgi:membrane protease YdiL (CAAX protease family)